MSKLLTFVRRRLWIKVLIPVSLIMLLVMGVSLWMGILTQKHLGQDQLAAQNKILAKAIEGGMFEALAVGDNDTVRTQFRQLNEKIKDLKVYVYDFNQEISFSTEPDAVGKQLSQFASGLAAADVAQMVKTGQASPESFEMNWDGRDYVIKSDAIHNEKRCYHCHGSQREVLGGISVLSSMDLMKAGIISGRNQSIVIAVVGLCFMVALVWALFHFLVNRKVGLVLEAAARLRQKDFSHETETKEGDEINHILNRISLVTRDLRQTIQEVVAGSIALDESSGKMTAIAATLDDSSTETSKKASGVSAAAEEMSANNRAIASAMEDASASLNAVAAAVDEMTASVGEIAKNASASKMVVEKVVASFEEILVAVEDLGVKTEDVDQVTDEIRAISEHVSLLALNAKIEAARAGEAGKGFAVVAQEITELASDTNRSTMEADAKLARMKTTVKDLVRQVTELTGSVKDSDEAISGIAAAVEEQNATTVEIARNINDVTGKIGSVNESVSQGAMVASEIARDIVAVEDMSARVQEESHSLSQDAGQLSRMAEKFSELMRQFKV